MSREDHDRLTTADLVAGSDPRLAERAGTTQDPQVRQNVQEPDPAMRDAQMREAQAGDARMRDTQVRDQASQAGMPAPAGHEMEQLAALFPPQMAAEFRNHWDQVQIGFVDDPRRAVQQADELVAQVMKNLASGFAEQRSRLEAGLGKGDEANTENLRMALRSYRSFFQRLLSL